MNMQEHKLFLADYLDYSLPKVIKTWTDNYFGDDLGGYITRKLKQRAIRLRVEARKI